MSYRIATLTPIVEGAERMVRDRLDGLPAGNNSPFARVPGTHFARLFVAERSTWSASLLGFSAVADVSPGDYFGQVHAGLGELTAVVWSLCVGWPGSDDAERFVSWLGAQLVTPTYAFATWDADVDRIRAALALRKRLTDFVPRGQQLQGAQLHEAFIEEMAR